MSLEGWKALIAAGIVSPSLGRSAGNDCFVNLSDALQSKGKEGEGPWFLLPPPPGCKFKVRSFL